MSYTFKSDVTVELVQHMGGDHMIVHAARVSTKGAACRESVDEKEAFGLINFLMKHRHGTPFEASAMTFFIHAPIFVWREFHRHRIGFGFNEESARYKTLEPVFYIPDRDRPMVKVENWKPGRPKFMTLDEEVVASRPDWAGPSARLMADGKYEEIIKDMKEGYVTEYERYVRQLSRGLDPGLARDNLPVGIYSSCWVTCNPRSLMHFLSLRTHDPDAKFVSYPLHEIELGARTCEKMFADAWPLTWKAFVQNGRVAP